MDGNTYVDIFAMKGPEYLMIIGMLLLSIPFWLVLKGGGGPVAAAASAAYRHAAGWFRLPEGLLFHQGHSWARPLGEELVEVGVDEFAQKLVGPLTGVMPPKVGAEMAQGEPGFGLEAGGVPIPVLSPVAGSVVEVNDEFVSRPAGHSSDPYGPGAWLFRVRLHGPGRGLKNLLSGEVARRWMDAVEQKLMAAAGSRELGVTYADGGAPMDGLARSIDPENWTVLAREFLLVSDR